MGSLPQVGTYLGNKSRQAACAQLDLELITKLQVEKLPYLSRYLTLPRTGTQHVGFPAPSFYIVAFQFSPAYSTKGRYSLTWSAKTRRAEFHVSNARHLSLPSAPPFYHRLLLATVHHLSRVRWPSILRWRAFHGEKYLSKGISLTSFVCNDGKTVRAHQVVIGSQLPIVKEAIVNCKVMKPLKTPEMQD